MNIRCLAIDDEPLALQQLVAYINMTTSLSERFVTRKVSSTSAPLTLALLYSSLRDWLGLVTEIC